MLSCRVDGYFYIHYIWIDPALKYQGFIWNSNWTKPFEQELRIGQGKRLSLKSKSNKISFLSKYRSELSGLARKNYENRFTG